MNRTFIALALIALSPLLAGAAAPSSISVKPASLLVRNPPETKEIPGLFLDRSKGTEIVLFIASPTQSIISIDDDASKITTFTDDKRTDLLKSKSENSFNQTIRFTSVSEDAHYAKTTLAANSSPAETATHIKVAGSLAVLCGQNPKTEKTAIIDFKEGTKATLGQIPVTISIPGKNELGDAAAGVTFKTSKSFDAIKSLKFLDAAGTEIKSHKSSSSKMSFGNVANYEYTYTLDQKPAQVTLEVTYWQSVQTIQLPINLNVGVGL